MLGTLLDQIPATFSRRFLLSHFLPLLLFCIANLLIAYTCVPAVQEFASWFDHKQALVQAFLATAATILIAATGLIMSGVSTMGRNLLEGRHLPSPMGRWLRESQMKDLERVRQASKNAKAARRLINGLWNDAKQTLSSARNIGSSANEGPCNYPEPARVFDPAKLPDDVAALRSLVEKLAQVLKTQHSYAPNDDAHRLRSDHLSLIEHIKGLSDKADKESQKAEWEVIERFPGEVAYPTRYGRIAGSIKVYAESRYGADYEVIWPRIEAVVRKGEPELFSALQEASTQLDFYVGMFWLTAASFVGWSVALPCIGLSLTIYILIQVVPPVLCVAWYRLGASSYEMLTEQVRTAMDLGRLRAIEALGLKQPQSDSEERRIWADVGSAFAFGGGVSARYAAQASGKSEPDEYRVHLRLEEPEPTPSPKPSDS